MAKIVDYTNTCGYAGNIIAAHGQGTRFAMIQKWDKRGQYCVYLADLSQTCEDENDQSYACQKWQSGNLIYSRNELKAAGYNFKKPNPLCLS